MAEHGREIGEVKAAIVGAVVDGKHVAGIAQKVDTLLLIAKVVVGAGSVVCTAFLGWVVTTYAGALVSAIASAALAQTGK